MISKNFTILKFEENQFCDYVFAPYKLKEEIEDKKRKNGVTKGTIREELADMIGCTPEAIRNWEQGKNGVADPDTIYKMAKYFNASYQDFVEMPEETLAYQRECLEKLNIKKLTEIKSDITRREALVLLYHELVYEAQLIVDTDMFSRIPQNNEKANLWFVRNLLIDRMYKLVSEMAIVLKKDEVRYAWGMVAEVQSFLFTQCPEPCLFKEKDEVNYLGMITEMVRDGQKDLWIGSDSSYEYIECVNLMRHAFGIPVSDYAGNMYMSFGGLFDGCHPSLENIFMSEFTYSLKIGFEKYFPGAFED